MKLFFALTLLIISFARVEANGEQIAESLKGAESAYTQGDFARSVIVYQDLINHGHVNGHVFYNLGNAEYRLGHKGKAIAAYLAARQLLPRDPDVIANLRYVEQFTIDRLGDELADATSGRQILFWTKWFTIKEQVYLLAWLMVLALLCLGSYWIMARKKPWTWLALLGGLLSLTVGFGVGVAGFGQTHWGAVVKEEAPVFSDPSSSTQVQPIFTLHEGAPFALREERTGWMKVDLANGQSGWLQTGDAVVYRF